MMTDSTQRDIGALQADMRTVKDDLHEIRDDLKEVRDLMQNVKGGWKLFLLFGTAMGAFGAALTKLAAWFYSLPR